MTQISTSTTTTSIVKTTTTMDWLERLIQDSSLSQNKKLDCLKTLNVILRNLIDPKKCQEEKYRTLKCSNSKLRSKLFVVSYIMDLLQELGFEHQITTNNGNNEEEAKMIIHIIDIEKCRECLEWSTKLQQRLGTPFSNIPNNNNSKNNASTNTNNKHPPLLQAVGVTATQQQPKYPQQERLSEKQKARRLLEEKERLEKEHQKEYRKRNIAMLNADKIARQTDPNWKAGVSAACAKSGTGIRTFRDKYGES